MKRINSLSLLGFICFFCTNGFAQQTISKDNIVVIRDIKPGQTDILDQLTETREKEILQAAVADTYEFLSDAPQLQEIIRGGLHFVVNHTWSPTKKYFGWGPEDDPEYTYPDKNFCNASTPEGTIKINLSQKFMKTLDLGLKLGEKDPDVMDGVKNFYRVIIAHELLHTHQWNTYPVAALSMFPKSCFDNNGLCDQEMIKGTKLKIKYEEEAFAQNRRLTDPDKIIKFANAIKEYEIEHPEEFSDEGQYRLLSSSSKLSPLVNKLMKFANDARNEEKEITGVTKIDYYGEYRPCELIWELMNVVMNGQSPYSKTKVEAILSEWDEYMNNPDHPDESAALLKTFPYLKPVKEGFEKLYNNTVKPNLEVKQLAQNTTPPAVKTHKPAQSASVKPSDKVHCYLAEEVIPKGLSNFETFNPGYKYNYGELCIKRDSNNRFFAIYGSKTLPNRSWQIESAIPIGVKNYKIFPGEILKMEHYVNDVDGSSFAVKDADKSTDGFGYLRVELTGNDAVEGKIRYYSFPDPQMINKVIESRS